MKEFIIWPSANSTAAARLLCALVVVLALASCADNAPSLARAHRSSDPLLSILGPASGIETRDSRFVFRQSSFRRTAKDELTDIQASAIANAFAKNFLMWPELYASRGVPRPSMVDRHLNSCDETRYAASRFEPLASVNLQTLGELNTA